MIKQIEIRAYGKVQNVGFRFYTHRKALELGLSGYVRNEADGSVFILAQGEEQVLEQFVSWCRRGPDWARVSRLDVTESIPSGISGFSVR
jgi:acylphosphatase